jgi:hypothetical protein
MKLYETTTYHMKPHNTASMSDDAYSTRTQGPSQKPVRPAGQKSIRKELISIQTQRKLAIFVAERADELEDVDTTWINACVNVDGCEVFRKPNGILSVRKARRSESKRIDDLEARVRDLEQKYTQLIQATQQPTLDRTPAPQKFPEYGYG